MDWFSSDFHFNHKNICGPTLTDWDGGYRNFSSLEEMNNTIIDNLNKYIYPSDTLYFLGDFAFGDKSKIPSLRERINCKDIRFIRGNHDHPINKVPHLFTWVRDYHEYFVGKTLITMMHYPLGSWNGIGKGAINLHGHSHGHYVNTIGRQLDVGVDNLNFLPISLDDLIKYMEEIEPVLVDHHDSQSNLY